MFFTSSIVISFIRLSFIIFFLYYINRRFINDPSSVNFLEFLINKWFRYGSLILLIIFVLVNLKAYNLFNSLFLLITIASIRSIGINDIKKSGVLSIIKIKRKLFNFLKNIENKKSFIYWLSITKSKKNIKYNGLLIIVIILVACITFLSRYYFIKYDNYSLSDAWIYDLKKVIQFDSQVWFDNDISANGEYALINFYSKITYVSPEIALQVISILNSTLLAIIIFWVIHKLTPSKFLAPIIASLSFALIYVLTPLNVYYLLKVDPTFMALTFAIPMFVFFLKPSLLKKDKLSYLGIFLLIFIVIGLINLFTLLILIPPFFIIGSIFSKIKSKLINGIIILSFIIASAILFGIYFSACYSQKVDFVEFIHNNILSVSSYTYVPQLILPYQEILQYFLYITFGGLFIATILGIFNKENWRGAFVFFFYFLFLIFLTFVNGKWIDRDMLNNSLAIFSPIILGLHTALLIRVLNFALKRFGKYNTITTTALIIVVLFSSIYFQQKKINILNKSDQTPNQILDAYDKISQTFFPYSYSVVNDPSTQVISENKHFFMNYSYFLSEYSKIDLIYFKNKLNPLFIVKHPQNALTKSVLVFILTKESEPEHNNYTQYKNLNYKLNEELTLLKKRGRKINLFYDSKILKVYEIVNEQNESRISDLIF